MTTECDALTLYGGEFTANRTIEEDADIQKLMPDGVTVAYTTSNYGEFYHINWEECRKIKPVKTSTRGRKPNPPVPRTKERKGSGEKFDSCIAFGVIVDGEAYGIKVFRKKSWNIYSISGNNRPLAELIIEKLFSFINERLLGADVKLKSLEISLRNMHFQYPLPEEEPPKGMCWVTNIHNFRFLLTPADILDIWLDGKLRKALIVYDYGSSLRLIIVHLEDKKTYNANLYHSGKLYIYGGNREEINREIRDYIFGKIDEHRDKVVGYGIEAMKGCDKKMLRQLAAQG